MQIDPNMSVGSVARMDSRSPAATKNVSNSDQAAFDQSQALENQFNNTPDVRADLVERAVSLIGRVDYPPPQVIRRLSNLLAMSIDPND
ncbi:MAG TPA: hypothetical protein P5186_12390 [Candidatus Paceibacterota bacterium]|nr:hypothetical protein [Verrucomicrobiota bacterium]HRY48840.1 hypothetical protein [Candidatus Paceibacterota bacterium]HSA03498.1 hypothetical protein [Candidatus Paceibacterota bacterium]